MTGRFKAWCMKLYDTSFWSLDITTGSCNHMKEYNYDNNLQSSYILSLCECLPVYASNPSLMSYFFCTMFKIIYFPKKKNCWKTRRLQDGNEDIGNVLILLLNVSFFFLKKCFVIFAMCKKKTLESWTTTTTKLHWKLTIMNIA